MQICIWLDHFHGRRFFLTKVVPTKSFAQRHSIRRGGSRSMGNEGCSHMYEEQMEDIRRQAFMRRPMISFSMQA